MIQETRTYRCRRCGSGDIVQKGRNRYGNPQYPCKACGIGSWNSRCGIRKRKRSRFCGPIRSGSACGDCIGCMGSPSGRSGSRLSPPGSRDPGAGRGRGRPGSFVGREDRKVWMSAHPAGRGLRRRPPVGGLKPIGASGRPMLPSSPGRPIAPWTRNRASGLLLSAGIPRSVRGGPAMGGKPRVSASRWLSMRGLLGGLSSSPTWDSCHQLQVDHHHFY